MKQLKISGHPVTAKNISNIIDKITDDFSYEEWNYYSSSHKKKPWQSLDNYWPEQDVIEQFIGHCMRDRRKNDRPVVNWELLWSIFHHILDYSDISHEWEDQLLLIVYLLTLSIKFTDAKSIENKVVALIGNFYLNGAEDDCNDEECSGTSTKGLLVLTIERYYSIFNGLPSHLPESLQRFLEIKNWPDPLPCWHSK